MEPDTALTAFGFNQLESIVYCELLRKSPATGYRLAQRIGRVPANVYQSLKALAQKGAIIEESDAANATSYVPVPPDQLFASLRRDFAARSVTALTLLDQVHRPPEQGTLAQLRTVSQVIERARSMIEGARETVLFDIMPGLLDLLEPEIAAARARGLLVGGIAYHEEDSAPTIPFTGEPADSVARRWPGPGMVLVIDASEQMVAQVSTDLARVLNAVYSDSPFLSCIMHGLLHAEIRLVALRGEIAGGMPPSPLDALTLQEARPRGLRALMTGWPTDTEPTVAAVAS